MTFVDNLKNAESIVCMGMDPVEKRIPLKEQSVEKKIVKFYSDILNCVNVGCVKPNYAFFAQYGFSGLRALKKLVVIAKSHNMQVILDAKRGDVGKSSLAYANEVFNFWKVDAVTVSPYMGRDSIQPFIDFCKKGKGVYVLVRTSNQGSEDFQDLETKKGLLFMRVAQRILDWHQIGMGAVVGATNTEELQRINSFFESSKEIPFLIPGVGSQGASAREVVKVLKGNLKIHRINSSSGINYAYEETNTKDYADAACKAVEKLNNEIGKIS